MEFGYNILFSLQPTLGGAASGSFSVVPLPDTLALMRDHGMVFKPGEQGSFVAAEYFINDLNNASLLRPLTGIVRFSFVILLKDTNFFRHADLQNSGHDTDRVGRRTYYFNNLDTNNTIDGQINNNQLSLPLTAYLSAADMGSVIPASLGFPVDATKYNEVELYQVLPAQADKKLASVFTGGMPRAQFILNGYTPGAYQLRWKGVPARTENIYANNELVKQKFFAIVEIYKDSNANNAILQDKGTRYTIPFKQAP